MEMSNELQTKRIQSDIQSKIYIIRGFQVMLDSDLAELYGYTTKAFNQQVKNNIAKFPEDMMFQLTSEEFLSLRSKNLTSSWGGKRYSPYAFTEQGIYMLMTVLKGELATKQSLMLVRMFKQMHDYIIEHDLISEHLTKIDMKLLEQDKAIGQIFKQLEEPRGKKAILFFKGQMYDAFSCIAEIIRSAKKDIILIDGYVDTETLDLLSKKQKAVSAEIYSSRIGCSLTKKEITDFSNQYGNLTLHYTNEFHDRFLILDRAVLYHIGASIKDAGKKAFEISLINDEKQVVQILARL